MTLNIRRSSIESILHKHGQQHLLGAWDRLSDAHRESLLDDLSQIDLDLCSSLIDEYVRQKPHFSATGTIAPAEILPAAPPPARSADYEQARRRGADAIAAGKVAAFTVAGGQGTRLGYDGPKGGFCISPIRNAPLFQLFAEYLLGVERRFGRRPRWYIMTSPGNHAQTTAIFERNNYFGLNAQDVRFFPQGQMPAFMPDGRIAMSEPHRLALSPDGHGGSLRALRASGALEEMRGAGIEYVSYFQVDNPLVHLIDPLFIGLHIAGGSQMSSKAVTKAADTERVGNFCRVDGRVQVIEYSDLPESLAHERNPDGSRRYDAGSIAIHIIDRVFVEQLTAPGSTVVLPWHRADKRMPIVNPSRPADAAQPGDVVKLEMFVFDAIPLARNPLVLYTPREEEFSPVKNAEGVDSPATSRRDQIRRAARWLSACGVSIPKGADGEPAATIEIAPTFAVDVDDLRVRVRERPVQIQPGANMLLR